MASIQKKAESYYCRFCYQGRRHTVTVGAVSRDEAEAFRGKTDYLLRIRQGFVRVPPGVASTELPEARSAAGRRGTRARTRGHRR